MKIQQQAAIVTGGGSGMGAAAARLLAEQGAKVALLDQNSEAANNVADDINGIAIACDVSSEEQLANALQQAREKHGPARICINCAGIAPAKRIVGREGPMPLAEFSRVIDVNLIGTFNVMRLAAADMISLPALEDDERGVIINTASIAAFEGQVGQAAYSASKGGIVSLTLPAAREFAQFGVRVNTIAPGIIATPMMTSMPEKVQQGLQASTVFPKRLGKPEEFAQLTIHIITNILLNGETIRLDGAIRLE